jgi:preprotein translocase subunit SecE
LIAEEYRVARTRTRKATDNNKPVNAENKTSAVEETRKERSAPSTRQSKSGGNGILSRIPIVRGIVAYFRGVSSEMQKVTWPSREEATRLTAVVLGVTIAFAITLGLLDAFFGWWFRQAFHTDSEMIFLGIAALIAVVVGGGYATLRDRI